MLNGMPLTLMLLPAFTTGNLLVGLFVAVFVAPTLLSLPAMWTLPRGLRSGLAPMRIEETIATLQERGLRGRDLVRAATFEVHQRFRYCRRNSYDHYAKAYQRGWGYCQQYAYALKGILEGLGFEAEAVHALSCRFRKGKGAAMPGCG